MLVPARFSLLSFASIGAVVSRFPSQFMICLTFRQEDAKRNKQFAKLISFAREYRLIAFDRMGDRESREILHLARSEQPVSVCVKNSKDEFRSICTREREREALG